MIESYSAGQIVIEGRAYRRDVVVFPDRVDANWWRVKGHELAVEDLPAVMADPPQVLVVGTGQYGRLVVLPEMEQALAARNVRLVAQPTEAACQTFNDLVSKGQRVVAALHLAC